jgi:hypothetical protein
MLASMKISKQNKSASMKILNTLAAIKSKLGRDVVQRSNLTILTGIKGKSTIANALTTLKTLRWVAITKSTIRITDFGMENADRKAIEATTVPTSNKETQEIIIKLFELKPKAIELVRAIADGQPHLKGNAASAIGYQENSTWFNLLTLLKKHEIIVFNRDFIQLHDSMFPFGRP